MKLYFVCIGNAGRSQMAEAFAKAVGHEARSAGSRPEAHLHPVVVDAMTEVGLDISDRVPKGITQEDAEWADVIVTMGCGDACPVLPTQTRLDWELRDPVGLPLEDVRAIRDEIRALVEALEAPE